MDFTTSFCESGGDGKGAVVNRKDLRFTQLTISRKFRDREHPTVVEAVDLLQQRRLNPDVFELTVYTDREGVMWCENNRRLYVLRKAGVWFVKVKFTSNDYIISQRLRKDVKDQVKDPAFMPKIKGTAMSSFSNNLCPYELEAEGYSIAEDEEEVDLIKPRLVNPDGFGELTVYRNRVEDVNRCDDSRRLYGSVNGYMPRRLEDLAFMPKITGAAPSSSSRRQQSHEEEKEASLLEIVGTASVAVAAGFAAWKLFKGLTQSDDDDKNNK